MAGSYRKAFLLAIAVHLLGAAIAFSYWWTQGGAGSQVIQIQWSSPRTDLAPKLVANSTAKSVVNSPANPPAAPSQPLSTQAANTSAANPSAANPLASNSVTANPSTTNAPTTDTSSKNLSAANAVAASSKTAGLDRRPSVDASYRGNATPDYPALSRRLGEQGVVVLKVLISPAGRADEIYVQKSSGFKRLDDAAVSAIRDWRFIPASQAGIPVAAWHEWAWEFKLKNQQN